MVFRPGFRRYGGYGGFRRSYGRRAFYPRRYSAPRTFRRYPVRYSARRTYRRRAVSSGSGVPGLTRAVLEPLSADDRIVLVRSLLTKRANDMTIRALQLAAKGRSPAAILGASGQLAAATKNVTEMQAYIDRVLGTGVEALRARLVALEQRLPSTGLSASAAAAASYESAKKMARQS